MIYKMKDNSSWLPVAIWYVIIALVVLLFAAVLMQPASATTVIDSTNINITTDYFAAGYEGSNDAFLGINTPAAQYYNGKTYIAYQSENYNPYITYFDHATNTWGTIVKVGTSSLVGDSHGAPVIYIDRNKYIHIFCCSHTSSMLHFKSTNPENISLWTQLADITSADGTTYPQVLESTDKSYMTLLYRGGAHTDDWMYRTTTDNAATFGAETALIDGISPQDAFYLDAIIDTNDTIHVGYVWNDDNNSLNDPLDIMGGTSRYNIYYIKYNKSTGFWYNITNYKLTLPINRTVSDASALVYNSSLRHTEIPFLAVDVANNIHMAYTTSAINYSRDVWYYKHTYWNGTAWNATNVTSYPADNVFDSYSIDILSNDEIDLYLTSNGSFKRNDFYDRGGSIEKYISLDSGLTWSWNKTISSRQFMADMQLVKNYNSTAKLVFTGISPIDMYYYYKPVFLAGDNGYVQKSRNGIFNNTVIDDNGKIRLGFGSNFNNPYQSDLYWNISHRNDVTDYVWNVSGWVDSIFERLTVPNASRYYKNLTQNYNQNSSFYLTSRFNLSQYPNGGLTFIGLFGNYTTTTKSFIGADIDGTGTAFKLATISDTGTITTQIIYSSIIVNQTYLFTATNNNGLLNVSLYYDNGTYINSSTLNISSQTITLSHYGFGGYDAVNANINIGKIYELELNFNTTGSITVLSQSALAGYAINRTRIIYSGQDSTNNASINVWTLSQANATNNTWYNFSYSNLTNSISPTITLNGDRVNSSLAFSSLEYDYFRNGIYQGNNIQNNVTTSIINYNQTINFSNQSLVDLTVIPTSPINITVPVYNITGDYHKTIIASSDVHDNPTQFIVGGNPANTRILVKLNGANWTQFTSDGNGYVTFTYNGWSDNQFDFDPVYPFRNDAWSQSREDSLNIWIILSRIIPLMVIGLGISFIVITAKGLQNNNIKQSFEKLEAIGIGIIALIVIYGLMALIGDTISRI